MKLAVSNIAWTPDEEPEVAELLKSLGVDTVEIAPTKTWDEPIEATIEQIEKYKAFWNSYDIEIVAFQSMLFAHPEFKLFESEENRQQTLDYLKSFVELAGKIGAKRMVFGSPKNRQKDGLSAIEAEAIAKVFFTQLGETAKANDVVFCIEPNAPQYACDFITNADEGDRFVRSIGNQGFGLHLDAACMALAGDDLASSIKKSADILRHYHISSPMLGQVEDREDVDHVSAAQALKDINYDGFVSIEMRPGDEGTNAERVKAAVEFAKKTYLG